MPKFEIKHRYSRGVLFGTESPSLRQAVAVAVLGGADLHGADLGGADLRGAVLRGADLRDADLGGADLRDAVLGGADLHGADLHGAVLSGADLRDADLSGADLSGADLSGADLDPLTVARTSITPAGAIVGWKKCRGDILVKLVIPEDARRSNATGRKCRAEFATVLEVVGAEEAISKHDAGVIYRTGETVRCHQWDEYRWNECSGGIHFFLTREEAEAY